MMLMRDRSGRSGRRRGSQKPGTAIGWSMVFAAGAAGDDVTGCAAAGANVAAPRMAANKSMTPLRPH